ncbi:MAG: ATP-binding protein [Usitatibacteraceae bacterium]
MPTENTPRAATALPFKLTPQDREFIEQPIFAEQTRLLYRFSVVGYLVELMVTFLLGAILWEEMSRPLLFVWFITTFLVMLGRYGLYKLFIRKNPAVEAFSAWEWRFVAGSILLALLWAAMGTVLLPETQTAQMPVIMLIALMTTGSVAYFAPHRTLCGITTMIALLPMSILLVRSGVRTTVLIGGALLVLTLLLVIVHTKVHRALLNALSARFDNVLMAVKLEEEKSRAETEALVVIGEMALSVAHSIRNPLANIRSSAELIFDEVNVDSKSHVQNIIDQADAVLRESVGNFAGRFSKAGIAVDWVNSDVGVPPVMGNRSLLLQAFNSIIANAVEVMPNGGKLTLQHQLEATQGRVKLSIADTGHGMSEAQLELAFKPFHTTKPRGLGIGLTLVKRTLERYRGSVQITSRENAGTRVELTFVLAG